MGGVNSKTKRRKSKSNDTNNDNNNNNNNFHINDNNNSNDNNYLFSNRRISTESSSSYRSSSSKSFEQFNVIKTYGNRKYFSGENARDIFPIDDDELKRLELSHFWSKKLWKDDAFLLPVDEVFNRNAKVLDIGCGSGIWSLDMARKYPNCHFTGFDILANFPSEVEEPNVDFTLGNILEGLPYEDNKFDLVFMRNMKSCFTQKDYNICLQEIVRVSRRWILILDSDVILIGGGPLANQLRVEILDELLTKYDINMLPSSIIRKCLEDNDQLSNIYFEDKQCPIGEWGGKLGTIYWQILKWAAKNLYHSVSSLGYSEDEFNLRIDEAFDELNQYNSYDMVFRIYAQKNVEKRNSFSVKKSWST